MPKQSDYSKTQIYRLVCKNMDIKECYIGSTTNWIKRRCAHKSHCNNEKSNKGYNDKKYQFIRENGGWNEWDMVLVEEFPCENNLQARQRERYWQEHFASNLNTRKAHIDIDESKVCMQNYKQTHREELNEKQKIYYLEHTEQKQEYDKKRNDEKIICECGGKYSKVHKVRHEQSQKHISFFSVKEEK